jgi:hypothetical protein
MDALMRKYERFDQVVEAMRALTALEVNYRVDCRRASQTYSNMPHFHRTAVDWQWTITIVDPLNDPKEQG